jgi:transposase
LNNWSYFQLQNFIEYKTIIKGKRFIKVSPYMTSQTCSRCGQVGSLSKSFFKCSHCGYTLNADLNASFNLAKRNSISDCVSVDVNQPYSRSDEVKGTSYTIATELMAKAPSSNR